MDHRERMVVPEDHDRAGTESSLMNTPSWHRVKEIIEAVLARPGAERRALILKMCGEDASLQAEVESLLAAIEQASNFIEGRAFNASSFGSFAGWIPDLGQRALEAGSFLGP